MSKVKLPCEIVEDILPSYVDELTNETTNQAMREHLQGCESCRNRYRSMKGTENYSSQEQEIELDFLKKTRKRSRVRIVLGVVAAVFLALGYLVYASFNGSFIQKLNYTKEAKAYVAEHYPDKNYVVENAVYDFKMNSYYCRVSDPDSQDIYFNVYPSNGEMTDDYDTAVNQGWNTQLRLSKQLDEVCEEQLIDFPWRQRLMMLDFDDKTPMEGLTADMEFDLQNLPGAIEFTLWIESDHQTPTWEEAEEKLVEVKKYMESKNIPVAYYSLLLEYPYEEDKDMGLVPTDYNSNVMLTRIPAETIDDPEALHQMVEEQKAAIEAELAAMEAGENSKDGEGKSYEEAVEEAVEETSK